MACRGGRALAAAEDVLAFVLLPLSQALKAVDVLGPRSAHLPGLMTPFGVLLSPDSLAQTFLQANS